MPDLAPPITDPAHLPADEVLTRLQARATGLTTDEATEALARWGANRLPQAPRSRWEPIRRQFENVLVYVLLAALALSIATPFLEGGPLGVERFLNAIVIGVILVLNAALGIAQELRAEQAIAELEALNAPRARVRRDGHVHEIDAAELVPGDVLVVDAGDRLSADARLLSAAHLATDESTLTGEAEPVDKGPAPVAADAPLAEQTSLVFGGTLVARGSAEAVVVATGAHTQLGRIATLVATTRVPATPLQKRLDQLGRNLGAVAVLLCLLVVAVGVWRAMPVFEVLLVALSLAVSAVPEGLPAVVTVSFAIGVRRMVAHHALVRRLGALETLGAVTVVCTDKTGTVTANRMTVVDHRTAPGCDATALAQALASCSHGELPDAGDPTELALLAWADALGAPRLPIDDEEVPFTSEERYMRTRHCDVAYLKGSARRLMALADDPTDWLDDARRSFAERGLRVLAAAEDRGDGVRILGLVGLEDPPRDGVREAIAEASSAGIRTVMITGDDPDTAAAIGRRVGIEGPLRTGREVAAMDADALARDVAETAIYARVSPAHKVALCDALLARGEVVAMSGDGVNDAPALKRAHVGVAMGLRGTDVAREAADIVLADDHFATIVRAIREGRRIHANIRRFVLFLLRANFDEILVILAALVLALPMPLLPIHILWINLVTDGPPALALATESAHARIMERPPRDADAHLLAGSALSLVAVTLVNAVLVLAFYIWRLEHAVSIEQVRTETLTLVIAIELVQAISARSERPIWQLGPWGNPWMNRAVVGVVVAQALVLYTPLAVAFQLVPPDSVGWTAIVVCTVVAGLLLEGLKLVLPTREPPHHPLARVD